MAAAASSLVSPAVEAAKEERQKFDTDPMEYVGNLSLKIGIGFIGAGAFAYAASQATARASQQFLSDIDRTMGIPAETPPTGTPPPQPPPPPTPPPYLGWFNQITADLNGLDTVDAGLTIGSLRDAVRQAFLLRNKLWGVTNGLIGLGAVTTQTPPPGSEADVVALTIELCRAIYFLSGYTPDLDVTSSYTADEYWTFVNNAVTDSTNGDFGTQWQKARDAIGGGQAGQNAKAYLNALAGDLGIQPPYDLTSSTQAQWGAIGVVVSTIASVEQGTVGAVEGAAGAAAGWASGAVKNATALVGDVENGFRIAATAIINLPRLAADGIGYGLSAGINTVTTDAYPFLLGIGGAFLGVAVFCKWFWPKYGRRIARRVELRGNARVARWFNRLDKRWGTRSDIQQVWTQKSTEAMIHSANAEPTYVEPVAEPPKVQDRPDAPGSVTVSGLTGEAGQPPPVPESGPGGPSAAAIPQAPEPAPEAPGPTAPASPEPPANDPPSNTPPEVEAKGQGVLTPTSDVEAQLGEPDTTEEVPTINPGRAEALRAHSAFDRLFPEDKAAVAKNDERLTYASNSGAALDIADEKTAVIEMAREQRREAKVEAKHLSRAKGRRTYRGFMEGAGAME